MIRIDRIRLVRDKASGVEAIHARFAGHAYDLHRHDDWLIGTTQYGVQDFFCRGNRRRSTTGRVILIEPHEAHDGQAGNASGFAYHMLYLPQPWVQRGLGQQHNDTFGFRATLADDVRLAAAIRHAYRVLADTQDALTHDAALDAVMHRLLPHLGRTPRGTDTTGDSAVARRARDCLQDCLADNIGADELARIAGAADRFQLARSFRAAYGAAPHAYRVQLRLLRARQRLAVGDAPADVAAACGFADQSHFGRWFRRAYGVTPAAYRACCTGVPDTGLPHG